jgi:hypothetical protein
MKKGDPAGSYYSKGGRLPVVMGGGLKGSGLFRLSMCDFVFDFFPYFVVLF